MWNTQIQNADCNGRINTIKQTNTASHTIFKLQKNEGKEKFWKKQEENNIVPIGNNKDNNWNTLLFMAHKNKNKVESNIKVPKEKNPFT